LKTWWSLPKKSVHIEIISFTESRPVAFPGHLDPTFLSARFFPSSRRSASRDSCSQASAIDLAACIAAIIMAIRLSGTLDRLHSATGLNFGARRSPLSKSRHRTSAARDRNDNVLTVFDQRDASFLVTVRSANCLKLDVNLNSSLPTSDSFTLCVTASEIQVDSLPIVLDLPADHAPRHISLASVRIFHFGDDAPVAPGHERSARNRFRINNRSSAEPESNRSMQH
jgi:hypothetical protein